MNQASGRISDYANSRDWKTLITIELARPRSNHWKAQRQGQVNTWFKTLAEFQRGNCEWTHKGKIKVSRSSIQISNRSWKVECRKWCFA